MNNINLDELLFPNSGAGYTNDLMYFVDMVNNCNNKKDVLEQIVKLANDKLRLIEEDKSLNPNKLVLLVNAYNNLILKCNIKLNILKKQEQFEV